jgi:hypothetical protein
MNQIRAEPRRDPPEGETPAGGEMRILQMGPERAAQRQSLFRVEHAIRGICAISSQHRGLNGTQRPRDVERRVRSEDETGSGRGQTLPRIRPPGPGAPESGRDGTIREEMGRLHGREDPETAEPRPVLFARKLDVLDPRREWEPGPGLLLRFDRVQGVPDRGVPIAWIATESPLAAARAQLSSMSFRDRTSMPRFEVPS